MPEPLAPLPTRDFDFIEARLLAPSVAVSEAVTRLENLAAAVGDGTIEPLANRLAAAEQALMDECRAVRYALTDRRNVASYQPR